MAHLQTGTDDFEKHLYEVVHSFVIPVILSKPMPLIMNQRIKCLFLYQFYSKLCLQIHNSSIEALNSLLKPKETVRDDLLLEDSWIRLPTYANLNVSEGYKRVNILSSSSVLVENYKDIITGTNQCHEVESFEDIFLMSQAALFLFQNSNS